MRDLSLHAFDKIVTAFNFNTKIPFTCLLFWILISDHDTNFRKDHGSENCVVWKFNAIGWVNFWIVFAELLLVHHVNLEQLIHPGYHAFTLTMLFAAYVTWG